MLDHSSPSVLITGATGHVGFRTVIHALRAGYSVRATARSEAKANAMLSHPKIQALASSSRLSFKIIPDIDAPGAFNEAVRGVNYIIHIASPLATGDRVRPSEYDAYFIRPAVYGTVGILEAAKKSKTVRRIVITSSIVALAPVAQLEGFESQEKPISPTDRVSFTPGPYESEFAAYAASKVAALATAEAWVKRKRPDFDVIHLHPSFIEGRNDSISAAREAFRGTNAIVLGIALGKSFGSFMGATVHNEDVARTHVQALNPEVPGNTSYILSQPSRWNDVKEIVRKEFPEAVRSMALPNCGSASTVELAVDASLTEETFDFSHVGFHGQVRSVVGHYLELQAKASKVSRRRGDVGQAMVSSQQVRASA